MMPTITLSPRFRIALYLSASLALIVVGYLVDKGWAGDAEVSLVTKVAALATVLAAAKVDTKVADVAGRHEADAPD